MELRKNVLRLENWAGVINLNTSLVWGIYDGIHGNVFQTDSDNLRSLTLLSLFGDMSSHAVRAYNDPQIHKDERFSYTASNSLVYSPALTISGVFLGRLIGNTLAYCLC